MSKTVFRLFLIVFCLSSLPAQAINPTAKDVFTQGLDSMLVELTRLSYLHYDKTNNFSIYKLMYALSLKKRAELTQKLYQLDTKFGKEGWKLTDLVIGKGMFLKKESAGGILAYKYDDKTNTVTVEIAFRGTRDLNDWGSNLNPTKKTLVIKDKNLPKILPYFKWGQVHQGTLNAYNTIAQIIGNLINDAEELRKQHPNAQLFIRIGGHSLGGALATICAAHLVMHPAIQYRQGNNTIHLETYGSPRVFGVKPAKELNNLLGEDNIMRFVNQDQTGFNDIVPSLPLKSTGLNKFQHVGKECILKPTVAKEDLYQSINLVKVIKTPHRMMGYQNGYETKTCANWAVPGNPDQLKKKEKWVEQGKAIFRKFWH